MPTIVKELFKQIIDKITKMLSDQAKKQIQTQSTYFVPFAGGYMTLPTARSTGLAQAQGFLLPFAGGYLNVPVGQDVNGGGLRGIYNRITNILSSINVGVYRGFAEFRRIFAVAGGEGPLNRILSILERLVRTFFLPIEMIVTSILMPILPLLSIGLRIFLTKVMPYLVKFMNFMAQLAGQEQQEAVEQTADVLMTPITEHEEVQQAGEFLVTPLIKSEDIQSAFDNLKNWVNEMIDEEKVKSTIGEIKNKITSVFESIKTFVNNNLEKPSEEDLPTKLNNIWNTIKSAFDAIGNWFNEYIWKPMTESLPRELMNFGNVIWSAFNALGNWFDVFIWQPIARSLPINLQTLWNEIWSTFEGIKNWFEIYVWRSTFGQIPTIVNDIWSAIQNTFNKIKTEVEDLWNKAQQNIGSIIDAIIKAIKDLFNNIKNAVLSIFVPSVGGRTTVASGGTKIGGDGGSTSKTSSVPTASNVYLGGKPRAPAYAYQHGGWILEPIIGQGILTGRIYTIAERGPELVVPKEKITNNQSSINITININGNIIGIDNLKREIEQVVSNVMRKGRT